MSVGTTYLDHNASAPLLPEARDAIVAALGMTGNPSSVHGHGRALRALVDEARARVARLAGATREQVVFTSSATEAITQAIVAGARALDVGGIVVSAADHAAALRAAEATGLPVTTVGLDADGYSVEAGVRGALTPMLEGYALAGYEDGDEYEGDFYGRLGAQVKFNQNWGVAADVKFVEGDRQWFVGPRVTW